MFGLALGRMGRVGALTDAQKIAALFANSEPGAWYDPADLSTLFQDSAFTVPVTAVEQPVGGILDLSGRGNHASMATTTKRPVYSRRVNLLLATATLATQSITTSAGAYSFVFSGTGSVTLSGAAAGVYGAGTHSITCTAGTLLLTVSGAVQDASFHLLIDSHLVYQGINTATDYDADPSKFPAYLRFDGVDDAMQTGNIDFTGTDKMTVWAGVTKIGDAVRNPIIEVGGYGVAQGFGLYSSPQSAANQMQAFHAAANEVHVYAAGTPPNANYVLGLQSDLSAPKIAIRRSGVAAAESTASPGVGTYGNLPASIGSGTGGFYFNGRLYSLIVRGAQTPLSQIEATEAYIKQKMRLP